MAGELQTWEQKNLHKMFIDHIPELIWSVYQSRILTKLSVLKNPLLYMNMVQ